MSASSTADLVGRLIRVSTSDVADSIAYELSEQLYDEPSLAVLQPLFDSGVLAHQRRLTALLLEHSDRSAEAATWLEALVAHPDARIRNESICCAMEVEPRDAPLLARAVVARLDDLPIIAASVAVYLAVVRLDDLGSVVAGLPGELQEPLTWLLEGDYDDWEDRFAQGGTAALTAVAAAGRTSSNRPQRLELAASSPEPGVARAARLLAARKRPPAHRPSQNPTSAADPSGSQDEVEGSGDDSQPPWIEH